MTSHTSTDSNNPSSGTRNGVLLQGYQKKLKTMKKKYFVLYSENGINSARLEYYDSEKKFKARSTPKRTIILKNCFNINRRLDTKHNYVIALSTKEEVFCIVLETEAELNEWLRAMLALQRGEDIESESPKPFFEHVWQVQVQRKGAAEEKGIIGIYYVCLNTKSVTLYRKGSQTTSLGENRLASVEFYLTTIRRCGHSACFFYMDVGRHSAIGAGELWMQTEDQLIAKNMHTMIISAMSSTKNCDDGFAPVSRKRALSANEASKPIAMLHRRQTHSGNKPMNSSPLSATSTVRHQRTFSLPNGDEAVSTTYNNNHLNINGKLLNKMNQTSSEIKDDLFHQYVQPCHQRTRSLPLTEETSEELNSFQPSSFTSSSTTTPASLKLFNNNNTIVNIRCESCPNHMMSKRTLIGITCPTPPPITLISASCTTTPSAAAPTSIISGGYSNNSSTTNMKRKLSYPGIPCSNGNTTTNNNLQYGLKSHSVDESSHHNIKLNDKNNNHKHDKITIGKDATINSSGDDLYGSHLNGLVTNRCMNSPTIFLSTDCTSSSTIVTSATTSTNNNQPKKCNLCSSPTFLQRGRNIRTARSFTLGRDRCDSLPSRNRTTSECSGSQLITNSSMPPPSSRPALSNRPLSMCIGSRHSHSPPLNTLSPSTGCSESDGSSLSIDETDSFMHPITPDESGNFVGRYYNSHSSGGVIPEENCDDTWYMDKSNSRMLDNMNNANGRLTLPISTAHNVHSALKSSPAASHTGSVDMQSIFSPYSPSGTSPCEQTGGMFIPVSPSTDYSRGHYTGSSGGHSRASSLAEETPRDYVPMGPQPPQDYVDMEQSSKHHTGGGISSAASSSSIVSGTPSTDIRFAEYSLDKVKSRFTPDEDDLHPAGERPMRAYSVGSRPEHIKRKLRVDTLNTADQNNSRVRAFSVGSRAKVPRSDLYRGVLGPSLTSCHVNNNLNNNSLIDTFNGSVCANAKNKKSSSAPILVHKSQNSVDRMSDLMEIDFSKNSENPNFYTTSNNNRNNSQPQNHNSHSQTSTTTRYNSSFPLSVPNSAQQKQRDILENSPKEISHRYMVMKPGSYGDKPSPTLGHKSIDSGYLEMKPIGATKTPSLSSSPIKTSTSVPKSITSVSEESNYINMSPGTSAFLMQRMEFEDYVNMSPTSGDRLADISKYDSKDINSTDGYMEMSFSKELGLGGHGSENALSNHKECTTDTGQTRFGESRNVSSPIDIIPKEKMSALSLSDAFSKLTRRSDSHDSDIAIASSHISTIFPFSPDSPAKNFIQNDYAQRKCFVDGTSGTITLPDQSKITDTDRNYICDSRRISNAGSPPSKAVNEEKILNTEQKLATKSNPASSVVDALSSDYADMTLGSDRAKTSPKIVAANLSDSADSDYVNYIPSTSTSSAKVSKVDVKHDYAIMSHKIKKTTLNSTPKSTTILSNKKQPLVRIASGYTDSANNFTGFKPITSTTDETLFNKSTHRGSNSPKDISRQLSEQCRTMPDENSSGYELLSMRSDSSLQTKKILSRPNSVNSEKISPSKTINRPNSANSECMPSISTSSSTSTLCGSSSSSSTLCGSKSQSPLTSSRPQSFSDAATVGGGGGAMTPSRPDSVSSIVDPALSSRPPSVSSERELHYVSLDLPPASNNLISPTTNADGSNNNNSLTKGNCSTSGESSTSPSPNASGGQQQPTFTYAQIDFNKSESLKVSMNVANNQKNSAT